VSRTVVREAIRALREKGLVNIQPGRGTFITNGTSAAMRQSLGLMVKVGHEGTQKDLIQIRAILEPGIAALAARMATDEEIEQMRQAVDDMDAAVHSADQFIRADQEFHLLLARATRNGLIPMLIDPIVDLLWEQRKRIFLVEGGAERGQYHHKRILQAVIEHQPKAARIAMQEHMQQVSSDSGMIDLID
jgi:GntR family transcriptional repressor for pyruvate dehydrogenase complex